MACDLHLLAASIARLLFLLFCVAVSPIAFLTIGKLLFCEHLEHIFYLMLMLSLTRIIFMWRNAVFEGNSVSFSLQVTC